MKTNLRKNSLLAIFAFCTTFAFAIDAHAEGAVPGRVPVEIVQYSDNARAVLFSIKKGIVDEMDSLYKQQVTFLTDLLSPNLNMLKLIEPIFNDSKISGNDLVSADSTVQTFSNINIANLIKYYLAGSSIRQKDTMYGIANTLGDNGAFNSKYWESTQLQNVLPSQAVTQNPQQQTTSTSLLLGQDAGDALLSSALNPSNLLKPDGYKTDQDLNYSKILFAYVENNSEPPNVVKLFDSYDRMKAYYALTNQTDRLVKVAAGSEPKIKLTVPYSNDLTKKNTDVILDRDQYNAAICDLGLASGGTCGGSSELYQEYKNSYRAGIVARVMYLANLLDSYSVRVPIKEKNGKSLAQIQSEEASYRLQPAYLDRMKGASEGTIAYENLKLLAEIHHDLYALHQQNEKLIVLQSLSGLQSISFNAMTPGSPSSVFGKYLYCKDDRFAQTQECKQQGAVTTASVPGPGAGFAPTTPTGK